MHTCRFSIVWNVVRGFVKVCVFCGMVAAPIANGDLDLAANVAEGLASLKGSSTASESPGYSMTWAIGSTESVDGKKGPQPHFFDTQEMVSGMYEQRYKRYVITDARSADNLASGNVTFAEVNHERVGNITVASST